MRAGGGESVFYISIASQNKRTGEGAGVTKGGKGGLPAQEGRWADGGGK